MIFEKSRIERSYFVWLTDIVSVGEYKKERKNRMALLYFLYTSPFKFSPDIPRDENRAYDGIDLRDQFANEANCMVYDNDNPCSMLEMMVALSRRCEETIMSDDYYGDRTALWFWSMVKSLGLIDFTDDGFDPIKAMDILERFYNKEYAKTGEGGLFTLKHKDNRRKRNMLTSEIWFQMCWFLNEYMEDNEEYGF